VSKFDFSSWCEANGISSKTAEILKDQGLNIEEALKLLTQDDIAELGHIVKVSELIEERTWQSVILYDNEYWKLQHRHGFCWVAILNTRFLKKRQGTATLHLQGQGPPNRRLKRGCYENGDPRKRKPKT